MLALITPPPLSRGRRKASTFGKIILGPCTRKNIIPQDGKQANSLRE
jgi:hypothetical protein